MAVGFVGPAFILFGLLVVLPGLQALLWAFTRWDGIGEARADVREGRLLPVPVHLRDSHYGGSKRLGHGEGYQYAHDHPDAIAPQDYLGIEREYYRPVDRGFEHELAQRLAAIRTRLREG